VCGRTSAEALLLDLLDLAIGDGQHGRSDRALQVQRVQRGFPVAKSGAG